MRDPVTENLTRKCYHIVTGNTNNIPMEDLNTGASDLSPESGNKPSGGIFVFHYLFRKGKPWYTERNEFKAIKWEVPL